MTDDAFIASFIMPNEATNAEAEHPHYPDNSSVTLGYGWDVGQNTVDDLRKTWGPYLKPAELAELEPYAGEGVKKRSAKQIAAIVAKLRNIDFTHDEAAQVFRDTSLPERKTLTEEAFPGYTSLNREGQAALIDRVYFRGAHPERSKSRTLQAQHYVEVRQAIVQRDSKRLLAVLKSFRDEHTSKGTRNRAEAEYRIALDAYKKHGTLFSGPP